MQAETFRIRVEEKASFSIKSVMISHRQLVYRVSLSTIAYDISERRIFTAEVYYFIEKLSAISLNLITLNFLNPVPREMKNLLCYALNIFLKAPGHKGLSKQHFYTAVGKFIKFML